MQSSESAPLNSVLVMAKVLCIKVLVIVLFVVASAVSQTPVRTQGQSSTVTVTVRDPLGARISKAFLLVRTDALERDNPKPFYLELRTDKYGRATAMLPSGFYDVFVAAVGFAPSCRKLRVSNGAPASLKFALQVDRLMTREYGDSVFQ